MRYEINARAHGEAPARNELRYRHVSDIRAENGKHIPVTTVIDTQFRQM